MARKINDTKRVNWLADCTVEQWKRVFEEQFTLFKKVGARKSFCFRKAIDAAIRAERGK